MFAYCDKKTHALQYEKEKRYIIWPCYGKSNLYANEVETNVKNLYHIKDVKTIWEQLKDVILKVGFQYFHAWCTWTLNVWFDEECKAHLKMFKLAKDKNEKELTLYQY